MIITFDEDRGVIELRRESVKEEPYDAIYIKDLIEIWQNSKADTPQTEKTCDNCGTPRDKCVYCIEEDRMWAPQTEHINPCPMCGCAPIIRFEIGRGWEVLCKGHNETSLCPTRDWAIQSWNELVEEQTEYQRKVQEAEHRMAKIIADMNPQTETHDLRTETHECVNQTDCGWK